MRRSFAPMFLIGLVVIAVFATPTGASPARSAASCERSSTQVALYCATFRRRGSYAIARMDVRLDGTTAPQAFISIRIVARNRAERVVYNRRYSRVVHNGGFLRHWVYRLPPGRITAVYYMRIPDGRSARSVIRCSRFRCAASNTS